VTSLVCTLRPLAIILVVHPYSAAGVDNFTIALYRCSPTRSTLVLLLSSDDLSTDKLSMSLRLQLHEELPRPLVVGYQLDQLPGIASDSVELAALTTDCRQSHQQLRVSWMPRLCLLEDLESPRTLVCRVQGHAEDVAVAGVVWAQRSRAPQGAERL
jgi:hypothetical protein